MEKEQLQKKIYSKIDELPTLPVVIPKLLNLMANSLSSASDVTDLISHDPALTSKILKVANSAYYGFSQKISNMEHAVALLGFNMIKSLALSIGVIHNLSEGKKSSGFSHEGLWLHSLAVASVLQEIGKRFGKGDVNDSLFIIGLLHDIGKIVLEQFFSELFQQTLQEAENRGYTELHEAERKIIGFDHGEIGAMLLTRWNFPNSIIDPITCHHKEEIPDGTSKVDVSMLRIANYLVQGLGLVAEERLISPNISEINLKLAGINKKDLDDLKEYTQSIKDEIHAFFSALS